MTVKVITVSYRSTTPMFLGGANQQAEFRISSVRGALRFWWRSLQWERFTNPRDLLREESAIFGSSDQRIGRSQIRVRLLTDDYQNRKIQRGKVLWESEDGCPQQEGNDKRPGAWYLGYGCVNAFHSNQTGKLAGQLERECLMPGTFKVECLFSPTMSADRIDSVRQALRLLGTVGALGSRSRNGYGSLTMVAWEETGHSGPEFTPSHDPATQLAAILQWRGPPAFLAGGIPDWTAWSGQSRVITITHGKNERELLDWIGKELVLFRGWGKFHKVVGQKAEQRFPDDHHLFKNACHSGSYTVSPGVVHPKRVVFGLPHNYGKESNLHVTPAAGLDRRGSPLFIHIHHHPKNEAPIGVICFLPARFLPGAQPQLTSFGSKVALDTSANFWQPVRDFLDRLVSKGAQEVPLP